MHSCSPVSCAAAEIEMLRTNSVCNLTASPDSQACNKVSASPPAKDGCCCANASILFSFRLFTGSFYKIFGPPSGYLSRKTGKHRSEEHTSELQSLRHLVCR